MGDLNCQMLTTDALKALLSSAHAHEKERAIACLVSFLTSGLRRKTWCRTWEKGQLLTSRPNELARRSSHANG